MAKIIGRILNKIQKKTLSKIISCEQFGFFEGRKIHEEIGVISCEKIGLFEGNKIHEAIWLAWKGLSSRNIKALKRTKETKRGSAKNLSKYHDQVS